MLIASYEYDSWGKVISIKGLSGNEVTSENHIGNLNKIRYRGYYQDTETGFYYLMSRYYDPVTHRFLNADGYFQTGQGILESNMSAYCKNNPIAYADPEGKKCYYNGPAKLNPCSHVGTDGFCYSCYRENCCTGFAGTGRLDVYIQISTAEKKQSPTPAYVVPVYSYSGTQYGVITTPSPSSSYWYTEVEESKVNKGFVNQIGQLAISGYYADWTEQGGKFGWTSGDTTTNIGGYWAGGRGHIEWDTTVTVGNTYTTTYSGISIGPTIAIIPAAVAVGACAFPAAAAALATAAGSSLVTA